MTKNNTMKRVNFIVKAAIIFLFMLAAMVTVHAQVGPGGGIGGGPGGPGSGDPGTPGVPQDNAVPFDGGLSFLLLAAGAGVAKRKKHNA
ncbi:MAG: hypothetical protein WCP65_03905 [Bacteroidota bacterium]